MPSNTFSKRTIKNRSSEMRVILFFVLLVVTVFGLVVIWKLLPVPEKKAPAPPVVSTVVVPPVVPVATTTEPVPPATPPVPSTPPAGMTCDATNAICASESLVNAVFTNPMTVTGTAIAFESQFSWELYVGSSTNPSASGTVHTDAPDMGQPGSFSFRVFLLTMPKEKTGIIRLFESSPKDGSPTHVLNVPIRFSSLSSTIKVFKPAINAAETTCSDVTAVAVNVPRTSLPIETSVRTLLDASVWALRPMDTLIPEQTQLVSLVVSKGVATATFSPQLDQAVGGSCRVSMIRSQIENTLKQFPSVKSVVIISEGKTAETTLQP